MLPWGLLVIAGLLMELAYVVLWVPGHRLSHGQSFTYEYMLQHPQVWDYLYSLFQRFDLLRPGLREDWDFLVFLVLAVFLVAFGAYFLAVWACKALGGRWETWPTVPSASPELFWHRLSFLSVLLLIAVFALAFQVTLFLAPGLFSTDLFSYAMYGRIAGVYDGNPFILVPSDFRGDRLTEWVHPQWLDAPSVYGPVWVDLSWAVGRMTQGLSLADQVMAYKLLANSMHLVNVGLVWALLHRTAPSARLVGVLLYAWNPLILFEFAGNGHNDVLMVTFLLAAFLCYQVGRPTLGLVPLAMSMLVKYTTALITPFYLVLWARQRKAAGVLPTGLVMAAGGAIVLGVVVALYLPWLDPGLHALGPVVHWSQGPMYLNYPPDSLAWLLADLSAFLAGVPREDLLDPARFLVKSLARLLFTAYWVYEFRRISSPEDLPGASARVFLGFLLLAHTWVLPWYFSWPLAMVAVPGARPATVRTVLAFSLSASVVIYYFYLQGGGVHSLYFLPYLLPLVFCGPVAVGTVRSFFRARLVPSPLATGASAAVTAPHESPGSM